MSRRLNITLGIGGVNRHDRVEGNDAVERIGGLEVFLEVFRASSGEEGRDDPDGAFSLR